VKATPLILSLILLASQAGFAAKALPAHPDDLVFPAIEFSPPASDDYRHELAGGAVAYIVEDSRVPLVTVQVTIKMDELQLSASQKSLHVASGELMSTGNAKQDAVSIEEEVAYLGAYFTTFYSEYGAGAYVQTLVKDQDAGLELLFNTLKKPSYQEDRLDQWKDERYATFKERNDHPERIESLAWKRLIYSDSYWQASTQASVAAVTQEALIEWQARWAQPAHLVFSISGDVESKEMVKALNRHLKSWKGETQRFTDPSPVYDQVEPGVYYLHKDVNQCRVRCFLPGLDRDDPRWLASEMMNEILGAGGMSSRLLNRIRTEEGLAYSVGSRLSEETFGEGLLYGAFQTKSESVLFAMKLMIEEMELLLQSGVSESELSNAKSKLIEGFPAWFNSARTIASALKEEELSGRLKSDPTYFTDLRKRVDALTREDLQQAAQDLLHTNQLVWLLVGDENMIFNEDKEHQVSIEDFGTITKLPARDPLTQEIL
jgi:zinc protease